MSTEPVDQEIYDQLACYILARGDASFIHQLIVDAYAAQHASGQSKPIYVAFALAGLYLHNEQGFSGKEVQRVHMKLARNKAAIPIIELPDFRGAMQPGDVLEAQPGSERDAAIERWSASTWDALHGVRQQLVEWLEQELIITDRSRRKPDP